MKTGGMVLFVYVGRPEGGWDRITAEAFQYITHTKYLNSVEYIYIFMS